MEFEWDHEKSLRNLDKHGIDFQKAKGLWNDVQRIEIKTSYPVDQGQRKSPPDFREAEKSFVFI